MFKKSIIVVFVVALSLIVVLPAFAVSGGRPGSEVVIYVTGQELYYDSIVGPELPAKGPFQKLEMVDNQLTTEFGPGDHGYVGGRWWLDANGNNQMDAEVLYFSCPLLGPGRESP